LLSLCLSVKLSGAHDQDRTDDLVLTKDVLYQLSYMGIPAKPLTHPDAQKRTKNHPLRLFFY
jgi:hypothetical protein